MSTTAERRRTSRTNRILVLYRERVRRGDPDAAECALRVSGIAASLMDRVPWPEREFARRVLIRHSNVFGG